MAIEILDFPIKNCGSFHSYVKLPEGMPCDNVIGIIPNLLLFIVKHICPAWKP